MIKTVTFQISFFSNKAADALLHSFKRSINGFVVRLTEEEVPKIAGEYEYSQESSFQN